MSFRLGVWFLCFSTMSMVSLHPVYAALKYTRATPSIVRPLGGLGEPPSINRSSKNPSDTVMSWINTSTWLNTTSPITQSQFTGKFTLLSFFRFSSIQSVHIIDDLKKLQQKYADQLIVVGVNSPRFPYEGTDTMLRESIQRYGITFPIINDATHQLWARFKISAWPTHILLAPDGTSIINRPGENLFDSIDSMMSSQIARWTSDRLLTPSRFQYSMTAPLRTDLVFPKKISADSERGRIVISDTNHHRILIASPDGKIISSIGTGSPGFSDGSFATAQFRSPAGTVVKGNRIYVCDEGNHAIREIDGFRKTVRTLAGTGSMGLFTMQSGTGNSVQLNSPRDIAWYKGKLIVAMSGWHQLWQIDPTTGYCVPFAGNQAETLFDGPPSTSSFSEPSGIFSDSRSLFIADSGNNAIRQFTSTPINLIETLVGRGPIQFGDVDGSSSMARLQYPLGIVGHKGKLYIADSYNHKIKVYDLNTGRLTTLAGSGIPGHRDAPKTAAQFSEPSGICQLENTLFVADSNNHVIRKIDIASANVTTITLTGVPAITEPSPSETSLSAEPTLVVPIQHISDGPVTVRFNFMLPNGYQLLPNQPPIIRLVTPGDSSRLLATSIDSWPTISIRPPHAIPASDGITVTGMWRFEINITYLRTNLSDVRTASLIIAVPYESSVDGNYSVDIAHPIRPD